MKTVDFTQHLLSIQTELFRFAFKLTADREEANDLRQDTGMHGSYMSVRFYKHGIP